MIDLVIKSWAKYEKSLDLRDFSGSYTDLMRIVIEKILNPYLAENPIKIDFFRKIEKISTENIAEIDNGDYQGCLILVLVSDCYEPNIRDYLFTHIDYGSCSGCDAMEHAIIYDKGSNERQSALKSICLIFLENLDFIKKDDEYRLPEKKEL